MMKRRSLHPALRTARPTAWLRAAAMALVGVALAACDMFEAHPYDTRVSGETDLTAKNVARIEAAMAGRRRVRFAMISDTQRWYDETRDAVRHINAHNASLPAGDSARIDFVVHGGDLSDFGMTDEFLWQRDILTGFSMPWVTVIGNHDCLATGEHTYRKVFGPLNYTFTAGDVRFLMLNTNSLEYDHTDPVPDLKFLMAELESLGVAMDTQVVDSARLAATGVRKTVVLMHAAPDSEVFDQNVDVVFEHFLTMLPGLQFCLYGHAHHLAATDMFGDGVMWYQCPNIGKRTYLLFTINDEGYDYEVVEF